MSIYGFPKSERLCSLKTIQELFNPPKGKKTTSVFLFPFKIVALYENQPTVESITKTETGALIYPKILISVPKKNFKHAVQRNQIKRQIREIYRTTKHEVFHSTPTGNLPSSIAFIFIAKELQPFELMKKKLQKSLKQLLK